MGTREQIQAAEDFGHAIVEVPEWGVKVEMRSLTLDEKTSMAKRHTSEGELDHHGLMLDLVVACSFDIETGERLFNDGDAEWLGKKNAKAVERLIDAAADLVDGSQEQVDAMGKGSSPKAPI